MIGSALERILEKDIGSAGLLGFCGGSDEQRSNVNRVRRLTLGETAGSE